MLKIKIKKEEKSIPDKVAKVNENELVSNTTSEIEQKTKTRRPVPQPPKKNGPRTRGVLFKRLPDGSIVNADLSDEELAKRAERKGRKNFNFRSKHNPATKDTESEKSDGESLCSEKKDTGDLHHDCDSKETAETDDSKKKNDSEEKNETTKEKTCSQRKEFVPSPGPVVSAWKAGKIPSCVHAFFCSFFQYSKNFCFKFFDLNRTSTRNGKNTTKIA